MLAACCGRMVQADQLKLVRQEPVRPYKKISRMNNASFKSFLYIVRYKMRLSRGRRRRWSQTMRISNFLAALAVALICLVNTAPAFAEKEGRGGPLPLLGLSALGQLGSAAGGAFLIWRRRKKANSISQNK